MDMFYEILLLAIVVLRVKQQEYTVRSVLMAAFKCNINILRLRSHVNDNAVSQAH